jgi:cell division protease FtsH
MSLGGRAAEENFLGEVSTGASSDLQSCNRIATAMVKRFGLSPKFRNMVFGNENEEIFVGQSFGQVQSYSDATAYEIDKEVQRIISECYEDTKKILIERKTTIEGLASRLIENYKVDGPEFEAIFEAEGDLALADKILEQKKEEERKAREAKEAEQKASEAEAKAEDAKKADAEKADAEKAEKSDAPAEVSSEEKTEFDDSEL